MLTAISGDGRRADLLALHLFPAALVRDSTGSEAGWAAYAAELLARSHPGRALPLALRWPPDGRAGPLLFLGLFQSAPLALPPEEGYSLLAVAWFAWHAERNLSDLVEPAFDGLAWADHAADFGGW